MLFNLESSKISEEIDKTDLSILSHSSSLSSFQSRGVLGTDWKQDDKCFVCKKNFGLATRHHCRQCGNSVCKKHSIKKSQEKSQEKIRICDNCDIEAIKSQIRAEIREEIEKIKDNIDIVKETYEKTETQRQKQNIVIKDLEEQIKSAENEYEIAEKELNDKFNIEFNISQNHSETLENIKNMLEKTDKNEKQIAEECEKTKNAIEETKLSISKEKDKKGNLEKELNNIKTKTTNGIPIEKIVDKICEKCKKRVDSNISSVSSEKSLNN